jgi:hypothetical protein
MALSIPYRLLPSSTTRQRRVPQDEQFQYGNWWRRNQDRQQQRRNQEPVHIPLQPLSASPAGFFLWKCMSKKMSQEATGRPYFGDKTWKRLVFHSFPISSFSSLFSPSIINSSAGKHTVSLATQQEIDEFFLGMVKVYRDKRKAYIVPPFKATFSTSSSFLSILFRYTVLNEENEEVPWVYSHKATYEQKNKNN